ncbi:hypothetical protein DI43_15360 [Geobacillus sp. CAMR12739]|nr:hypothetical protein DI43_15360 [Geobacillus sp. CAMR12739]
MLNEQPTYKVLLPRWIWEEAKDNEHFKQLVREYMRRYPEYTAKHVADGFAICVKKYGGVELGRRTA